jgi:hypothetical protein
MKAKPVTVTTQSTVAALVADGVADLITLGEEYREWYDNLPENFQDNRSDIDEAASTLENLTDPGDPPEAIANVVVLYRPLLKRRPSRADRGNQATYELTAAVEAVDAFLAAVDGPVLRPEELEAIEAWRDEVQAVIDEAEGVEYPGMFA